MAWSIEVEFISEPETAPLRVQICTLKRVCANVQRAWAGWGLGEGALGGEEEEEEAGEMTIKVRLVGFEFEFGFGFGFGFGVVDVDVDVDELLFATNTLLPKYV